MSLHPEPIGPVPEETARVAQAAFPLWNVYLRLHDAFGSMYQDEAFTALFPTRGRPAEAPWRLALVTLACLIVRQRMLSAVASTGSTCWGWSSVIRASITAY